VRVDFSQVLMPRRWVDSTERSRRNACLFAGR